MAALAVGQVIGEDVDTKNTKPEIAEIRDYSESARESFGNEKQEAMEEAVVADPHARDASLDLVSLVSTEIPQASLLSEVGTELKFQLPLDSSSKFPALLQQLDSKQDSNELISYGVSITTLDEVFLLVARGESGDDEGRASSASLKAFQEQGSDEINLDGAGLFFRHVVALFKKRAANFRRDKKAWVCTTLIPTLFVLVGFSVYTFQGGPVNLPPLKLDLSNYNNDVNDKPVNPVAVNDPANLFTCDPGDCVVQSSLGTDDLGDFGLSEGTTSDLPDGLKTTLVTGEIFALCGVEGRLASDPSCSITESTDIVGTLDGLDGIGIFEAQTSDIEQSSESLLASSSSFEATQYGAIWLTHDPSSQWFSQNQSFDFNAGKVQACESLNEQYQLTFSSADDCARFQGVGYVVQYNYTGKHTAPLFQSLADEALVRYATNNDAFKITATLDPMPQTEYESGIGRAADAFLSWFLVLLSFPFIAGAYATFIVQERQTKAKHLQTVSGVDPVAYWMSSYLWDILNYQIPLWLIVVFMFSFDIDIFTNRDRNVFGSILVVMILYGPASAGYAYCWSFMFKSANLCSILLIITEFIIAFAGSITVLILWIIGKFDPEEEITALANAARIIPWVLRISPSFCLGKSLLFAININLFALIEEDRDLSAWRKPIVRDEVMFLAIEAIAYPLIAVLLDIALTNPRILSVITCSSLYKQRGSDISTALPEDDDVIAEQDRVLNGEAKDDLIVVSQLSKVYSNGKLAVNNFSLGIPAGECFGLLGINGAGKTSVMAMLTAEFPPTQGDATLAGFSVVSQPEKIRRRIGYCPQFDAHFANMSGREHVELYAAIKGVPTHQIKEAVSRKLKEVGLSEEDSDRVTSQYSGGMRRRLSLACATMGSPRLVFLDECSTGVDPVARREIWQMISDMVSGGSTSVILTTHSMEECEALCPRIGIMANGRLRCLGSAQHLKNKFGQGYQVEMKAEVPKETDDDYVGVASALASAKQISEDVEDGSSSNITFNLLEAKAALSGYTGSQELANRITSTDAAGYEVWRDATAPNGVSLMNLATFCTTQTRMSMIENFVSTHFPDNLLRERQNLKLRYEISNENLRISTIFAKVEAVKEDLHLADYGVSQTSLEQVFNMHAAEAEKLKQGRNDR